MKMNKKYYKEISIALIFSIIIIILTNNKDFTLEYLDEIEKIEKVHEEIGAKKRDIKEITSDELKEYKNVEMEKWIDTKLRRDELKSIEGKLREQVNDKEKELERIEKEKIKKEEEKKRKEEDKEKEKKLKEEEKKRKEEAERRAGSWILESDGYNIWEAFLAPGTYSITVKHDGNGNIIGYLGDRNNPENKLLINEIGSGNFGATFNIPVEGYYTFTFIHDGAIEFRYQGL